MFENIAGRENFRRAVHNYLTEHLFGNARAEDFLEALGRASKPQFAAAFSTFLNQNGVPEISAELRCDGQRPPKLNSRQKRLLPLGSPGDAARTWTVPFCVAYSFGSGRQQTCQLLTKQTTEMNLPGKVVLPGTWGMQARLATTRSNTINRRLNGCSIIAANLHWRNWWGCWAIWTHSQTQARFRSVRRWRLSQTKRRFAGTDHFGGN